MMLARVACNSSSREGGANAPGPKTSLNQTLTTGRPSPSQELGCSKWLQFIVLNEMTCGKVSEERWTNRKT